MQADIENLSIQERALDEKIRLLLINLLYLALYLFPILTSVVY